MQTKPTSSVTPNGPAGRDQAALEREALGAMRPARDWARWLCVLVPIWYFFLGLVLDRPDRYVNYFLTEWMTTYTAGFVRRGLAGQTTFLLSDLVHVPPMEVLRDIRIVLAAVYLAVLGYGVFRNRQQFGSMGTIALLLSPMVAICGWTDFGSIDLLFILSCVVNAALITRFGDERYVRWAALFFATAGVAIALTHEAFIFLGLPLNIILTVRKLGWRQWPRALAIYALPVLACLVMAKFPGTARQADEIQLQWLHAGVHISDDSAFAYFGHTLGQEVTFVRSTVGLSNIAKCVCAAVVSLASLILLWRWLPMEAKAKKEILRDYFALPLLCTLPLYLIGTDWHRWVLIPFSSGILALLYSNRLVFKSPLRLSAKQAAFLACLILLDTCSKPAAPYFAAKSLFRGSLATTANVVKNLALYHQVIPDQNRF